MDMDRDEVNILCEKVIGAFFEVSNGLGSGFLEKVYGEGAGEANPLRLGITVQAQVPFSVFYKGNCVGTYLADLVVEGSLLVELKCVERLAPEHSAQCMNYLKASGIRACLMVNFQKPRVDWRRIVIGF